jgi:hypothetical protein
MTAPSDPIQPASARGAASTQPRHPVETAMTYLPGQRVALVYTSDPHTRLRPGDQGTVRRYHPDLQTVDIDWDNGSHLSMCLDAGDRIQPLVDAGQRVDEPSSEAGRWATALVKMRAAGDVRATARRILAGIGDGDPAVLDTLPSLPSSGQPVDDTTGWELYAAATGEPAGWFGLSIQQRDEALEAYRDGFDTAATDRAGELCRIAASPTGDGRDLAHLHPDRLRIGGVAVFAGDWAWTPADDGTMRIPVGFVGTLIDTWNGWAVFSCTRDVAEAIVADQQRSRAAYREQLRAQGVAGEELDRRLDQALASLVFDGDTIVADQRGVSGDPEAIERIAPDADGRYVVMGRSWCWEAVDPADCDRIVGDLPAPGDQQQFVLLTHTPGMRVPHDRLTVTSLEQVPTANGVAFTATLALDGQPVGTVTNDGNGGPTELYSPNSLFGWRGMRAYVADCRYRGEPASAERVLDALVDEYDLARTVAQAQAVGGSVARLLDEAGFTLAIREVKPAPRGWDALRHLAGQLAATAVHPRGHEWLIWTGSSWFTLPYPSPTTR